jgi:hypothetical protein
MMRTLAKRLGEESDLCSRKLSRCGQLAISWKVELWSVDIVSRPILKPKDNPDKFSDC